MKAKPRKMHRVPNVCLSSWNLCALPSEVSVVFCYVIMTVILYFCFILIAFVFLLVGTLEREPCKGRTIWYFPPFTSHYRVCVTDRRTGQVVVTPLYRDSRRRSSHSLQLATPSRHLFAAFPPTAQMIAARGKDMCAGPAATTCRRADVSINRRHLHMSAIWLLVPVSTRDALSIIDATRLQLRLSWAKKGPKAFRA